MATKLKVLNLKNCLSLRRTPDLSVFESLEILILADCENLKRIHPSVGDIKTLVSLDVSNCRRLLKLPAGLGISSLPESISKLSSLQKLGVGYCEKLRELPELPSGLTALSITCQSPSLPHLSQLTRLKELALCNCPWLEQVTGVEGSHRLSNLPAGQCPKISRVDGIEDSSTSMSPNASQLDGSLDLSDSKILQRMDAGASCANSIKIQDPGGSKSSQVSDILKCTSAGRLLDFSSFKYLRGLSVWGCNSVTEIQGLDGSESLTYLSIGECSSLRSVDLSNLKNLRHFSCRDCESLVEIRGLEGLGPVGVFSIDGCPSLRQSPELLRLTSLATEV
ncbi:hypothetical protein NL676_035377 [Syzygium grande]|nr:hypothetical protein NL676_035377 [Syzygium grande]